MEKNIFVLHSLKKTIHPSKLTTFVLLHLCQVLWTVRLTHSYSVYYRNLPPALRVLDKPSHVRETAEQHSSSLYMNAGRSVTPCHSPCAFFPLANSLKMCVVIQRTAIER